MPTPELLTAENHRKQIIAYGKVRPKYETYAKVLKRVFEEACRTSFPEAFIQARPKTVSSFAEKVARKFAKYPDAVNQMTDLCGARVIVQTTEQVAAVRLFIEANFTILEQEDKALLLSQDRFGYRDMHFIVELRRDRIAALRISANERVAIADRKAEIQVRTWLQHAWADTLHDRMYKNKLALSSDVVRTGALLAALMEEGDRTFRQLTDELDGLIANYTGWANRGDVAKEIAVQEVILSNEPDRSKKPALAMRLARLVAASGDYERVVKLLNEYQDLRDANRCDLLLDLGYSICKLHRATPKSTKYERGRGMLEEAVALCASTKVPFVPHLRNRKSLHARALARLGWAVEPNEAEKTRNYYRQAHEHEPANPYWLAQMLGFEIFCARTDALPDSMRTTIREAIKTCRQHALAGIELPYAHFTAGRLSLLLKEDAETLGYYARGLRHFLAETHCVPREVLEVEIEWITRLYFGKEIPSPSKRVIKLLSLGQAIASGTKPTTTATTRLKPPVLIVAGGAISITAAQLALLRPLVQTMLAEFQGTVIAGGTAVGVPGCVGDAAGELAKSGQKRFRLVGYVPGKLPQDAPSHKAYDELIKVGDSFQPDQLFCNWNDAMLAGLNPADVRLLGFGGGPLSMSEYHIALGLGASVGLVSDLGGAAEKLAGDPLWVGVPNLHPLPADPATLRAFVIPCRHEFKPAVEQVMAQAFHHQYVAGNQGRLPANLKPWPDLQETFKNANLEQARYSVEILRAAGFAVRQAEAPTIFNGFSNEDIEQMAEMEHGRWNVERMRVGWRYGSDRDDDRQIHNCLVSWSKLPEKPKEFDRAAVRRFPEILAQAKLEVYKP